MAFCPDLERKVYFSGPHRQRQLFLPLKRVNLIHEGRGLYVKMDPVVEGSE